jgi:hypothetical protein
MPTSSGPRVSLSHILAWIVLAILATGCTSTTVAFHSAGTEPPLCKDSSQGKRTVVYWGAAWRPDQKEVSRREAIIAKGIEDFFRATPCFSIQTVAPSMGAMSCC